MDRGIVIGRYWGHTRMAIRIVQVYMGRGEKGGWSDEVIAC